MTTFARRALGATNGEREAEMTEMRRFVGQTSPGLSVKLVMQTGHKMRRIWTVTSPHGAISFSTEPGSALLDTFQYRTMASILPFTSVVDPTPITVRRANEPAIQAA